MRNNTPIIEISNVHKTFATYEQLGTGLLSSFRKKRIEKKALDGTSLTINKGEIVALLGKNGSGKSTLIKLLIGIMPPDSGTIRMLGKEPWKDRIELARHFGVVLGAHPVLFIDLPAIDSFEYIRKIYNIPKEVFKKRLDYLIDLLELKDVYKRQVRELSLGESMKCNFVSAVLHEPKIIILDEPTIGVDLPSMLNLRSTILYLNKKYKITFIISTHILEDVKVMAERVAIIDKGKIVFDGTKTSLSRMFGDKKIGEIFYTKEPQYLNSVGKIISKKQGYAELEIDPKNVKSKKIITLLTDRNVEDFNISDPDISEIVGKFYSTVSKRKQKHTQSKT